MVGTNPAITTTTLPNGFVGTAYTPTTVTASGGTGPYTFTATGLPAGLVISSAGQITGTPTAAGTSSATFTVTDSSTPAHLTGSANISITILPGLTIQTTSLPNGVVGAAYTATNVMATGGTVPLHFHGDGLACRTGDQRRRPDHRNSDRRGCRHGNHHGHGFHFDQPPDRHRQPNHHHHSGAGNSDDFVATRSRRYCRTPPPRVAATGGTNPYTFTATGLPAGLSISATGQITGTPTAAGTSTAAITVTDSTNPKHDRDRQSGHHHRHDSGRQPDYIANRSSRCGVHPHHGNRKRWHRPLHLHGERPTCGPSASAPAARSPVRRPLRVLAR